MTRKTKAKPAPDPRSIVSADWRDRYAKHGGSCGDALSVRLRRHLEADDGSLDLTKLKALALLNGCWQPGYERLNRGMRRLNVGNRLRALARNGVTVKWPGRRKASR